MIHKLQHSHIILLAIFLCSCAGEKAPSIAGGVDACQLCNMVIDQQNQSCGYFKADEFLTFDSPQCLLNYYNVKERLGPDAINRAYFADYLSSQLHPVDSVYFMLTVNIPTVMNSKCLSFNSKETALNFRRDPTDLILSWREYWIEKSKVQKSIELRITDSTIIPDIVSLDKGDLVDLIFHNEKIDENVSLIIQGYENLGLIKLSSSIEEFRLRFYAEKPGAGFPIMNTNTSKVIGAIKVTGAHTDDEAVM
ncbi:nitrous oxide reductase accessory protein NosL [Calditrichota bacterium]